MTGEAANRGAQRERFMCVIFSFREIELAKPNMQEERMSHPSMER
jgi:hypothetical protein